MASQNPKNGWQLCGTTGSGLVNIYGVKKLRYQNELGLSATGSANLSLTELIDTPEIDEATQIRVGYRPPGQ